MSGMTDAEVLSALQDEAMGWNWLDPGVPDVIRQDVSDAIEAVAALIAERDALRANDARYRFLRDDVGSNRAPHIYQYPAQDFDNPKYPQIRDVGLDAAIDAAIKVQEAGEANERS